jgi:hypothetical protein
MKVLVVTNRQAKELEWPEAQGRALARGCPRGESEPYIESVMQEMRSNGVEIMQCLRVSAAFDACMRCGKATKCCGETCERKTK